MRFAFVVWVVSSVCAGGAQGAARDRRGAGPGSSASPRASVDPDELSARFWVQRAQHSVERRARHSSGRGKARNMVLFMGDGMSMPTLAAARTLLGQRNGQTGEEAELEFETFPTSGLTKTYCVNAQIPDSACTATAMLAGVKTNYGVLGLTAAVPRRDCEAHLDPAHHLDTIAKWALDDGKDVGIVTTTRVTHASPAALYATTPEREWENNAAVEADGFRADRCPDIAHQMVHMNPANKFKVILGGGRRELRPTFAPDEEDGFGRRTDGRDLIEEWKDDKRNRSASFAYVWNREQLLNASQALPEYLLGLFDASSMQFHMEANNDTEPTLAEMTEVAIRILSKNERGFFLFVEGGRIDHAHHGNLVHLALDETIELSYAVARAKNLMSEEESLLLVTADHSHVMSFNGYSDRGADVLGLSREVDRDGVPYMTLSYTNGPGTRPQVNDTRGILEDETDFRGLRWPSHADVPLTYETHGGDDVGVFAWGAHHDMFSGLYEQNQIPHLMAYAGCFGPGRHACSNAAVTFGNNMFCFNLFLLVVTITTCNYYYVNIF